MKTIKLSLETLLFLIYPVIVIAVVILSMI
jgi:hypothetical protein